MRPLTDVPPHAIVWPSLFAAGAAFEAFALLRRHEATLSAITRRVARTDTPAGRWAFAVGWTAFAAYFGVHILWPEKVPSL